MSATRHADGVRVHHLEARLPVDGGWSAQAITRALDQAPWPDTGGETWRIRHLHVRLPSGGSGPAQLGAAAVAALQAGLRRGEVVRFASNGERIAALVAALADGRAAREWWWEGEPALASSGVAAAIASVLCEEPAELPRIIARLIGLRALDAVWRALDDGAVARILSALVVAGRLAADHPVLFTQREKREHARSGTTAGPAPGERQTTPAPWPTALLTPWRGQLARLAPDDARLHLIAVLLGGQARPHTLLAPPSAAHWTSIVAALVTENGVPPATSVVAPTREPPPVAAAPTARAEIAATAAVESAWWDWQTIASDHVGIVYLLNALRHPRLAVLAPAPDLHLWRAWARRRGLPAEDALAGWLDAQVRDLPSTPAQDEARAHAVDALEDAASALYGVECWNTQLIRARGCVRSDPTHLIAHLPLASVRLVLRQAGLDLDPGWMPTLGRVVRIVYHASHEALPSAAHGSPS